LEDAELQRILQEKLRRMSARETSAAETVVRLTEANFSQYANGQKPLLVDFWAEWCGPCRVMEPVVERLAAKYSEKVIFGKVNVDEEMGLSSRYQVLSIPTFMVFRKGQPVDAVIGAVGEAALEQLLRRALNGSQVYG
jgi:thioredoxin 1